MSLNGYKIYVLGKNNYFRTPKNTPRCRFKVGAVAQSVEQRTENPCVGGSIPSRTTKNVPRPNITKGFGTFFFELSDSKNLSIISTSNVCSNEKPSNFRGLSVFRIIVKCEPDNKSILKFE